MANERNGADVSVKVAGQELNVRNVKSLNTILTALSFAVLIGIGVLMWTHVVAEDQSNKAILTEIKEQNKAVLQAQKNSAYFACLQACLLEQPTDRRNSTPCERTCAPVRAQ
jgi:cytochrome c-type biogenesis protein CcmH/NrfG